MQAIVDKSDEPENREPLPQLHIPPATRLAEKNPHSRDKHIQFFDVGHIYDVDGNHNVCASVLQSV